MPPLSRRRAVAALCVGVLFAPCVLFAQEPTPPPVAATPAPAASPVAAEVKPNAPMAAVVENSVVKVFSTVRYPDPYKPWTKQAPKDYTGSGAVIDGHRILTNAHVVLYASQIQVQANQAGDKLSATVEAIAPGIDLAILKLDDESFFDAHPPLPRAAKLPEIKDAVLVYGYPEGGTSLSITKGIVSRIEFVAYNAPVSGLRIQIDAAINPGNSGGPAVVGDRMIGLAFSHLGGAENIGYIIPGDEIELFLKDIADGRYDGKPAMFDRYQTLENPALRAYLKLPRDVQGIVIRQPDDGADDYPLKPWDVLTRIGGQPVDDQGMVRTPNGPRVAFPYLVQTMARDGKLPLTIVRAGEERQVELPVSPNRHSLIPESDGSYPSYFVYGPLVFSDVGSQFLSGLISTRGGNYSGLLSYYGSPLITRMGEKQSFPGERLVAVTSPFFPHKLAKGYSSPFPNVVKSVNGVRIKNLAHLVEVLRDCKDEFVVFDFDTRGGETPVFPRKEMVTATDDILTDNGVRSQGSPDVLAVWNKKD